VVEMIGKKLVEKAKSRIDKINWDWGTNRISPRSSRKGHRSWPHIALGNLPVISVEWR